MSSALKLALKFGGVLVTINDTSVFAPLVRGKSYQAVVIPLDQVEANYHAARAEALREAAELVGTSVTNGWPCAEELAAMADREGK